MSPRSSARTQACSAADAANRLRHALAGIAASDAACCKSLGRRSRGQDHRAAVALLETVEPGGKRAAKSLSRLLNLKDEAHYGLFDVGGQDLKTALHQARDVAQFAERVLQR